MSGSFWKTWLRRLGVAVAVLVVIALAVFGWAWLSTDSSTVARAMIWMEADIGDQDRFPARVIPTSELSSPLPSGGQARLQLDDLLDGTDTRALVAVHRDRVVYERYFGDADRGTLQTSFSVAKSFVSALVGIAIDEGAIHDVDDPVTDYVPELADRDPRFERITLRDLMTMASGLKYTESSLPWSGDDTFTYYGVDLREVALERSEVETTPGRDWLYNNYNPLLLGLVLEHATGTSVSGFMAEKLWAPLGASEDATWSLDSEDSGFEKMESGLNATALDYARFGSLYLHGGRWNGRRIVPQGWVRASTTAETATDYANDYGYFWWVDGERRRNFYALGNYGQYIYVAPREDVVIVRLGSDWGLENEAWLDAFRRIADELARVPAGP